MHLNEELVAQQIKIGEDYRTLLYKSCTSASSILGSYYYYLYPDLKRYKLVGTKKKIKIYTKHAIARKNIERYL